MWIYFSGYEIIYIKKIKSYVLAESLEHERNLKDWSEKYFSDWVLQKDYLFNDSIIIHLSMCMRNGWKCHLESKISLKIWGTWKMLLNFFVLLKNILFLEAKLLKYL